MCVCVWTGKGGFVCMDGHRRVRGRGRGRAEQRTHVQAYKHINSVGPQRGEEGGEGGGGEIDWQPLAV